MSADLHQQLTPTCPHCAHAMNAEEMSWSTTSDDDLFVAAPYENHVCVTCPACDLQYWVKGGYTPHYTSAFAEEDL